jgi:hypothetical protein
VEQGTISASALGGFFTNVAARRSAPLHCREQNRWNMPSRTSRPLRCLQVNSRSHASHCKTKAILPRAVGWVDGGQLPVKQDCGA